MALRDKLKKVVDNLKKQQEIKTPGIERAKRVAEAAKKTIRPK